LKNITCDDDAILHLPIIRIIQNKILACCSISQEIFFHYFHY